MNEGLALRAAPDVLSCAVNVTVAFPAPDVGLADNHDGSPLTCHAETADTDTDVLPPAGGAAHDVGDTDDVGDTN